jgi:LmbE family N-acetylglucosaminyl deacetylase
LLASTRFRSVRPPEHILWIGAHPDDESLVAPLLGGRTSSLIVMTRGEGGGDPSVRSAEMQRAADLFHADLELWDFADVMNDVDAIWSAEAGGHDALVARIAAAIIAENPSVVYTFDPNHGSSCHPAHREVGALVIEALARLGPSAPRVMFVETIITYLPDGFAFTAASDEAISIDARATWHWVVDDVAIHADQFTPAQVEALRNIPDAERFVWLATAPAQKYSCGR